MRRRPTSRNRKRVKYTLGAFAFLQASARAEETPLAQDSVSLGASNGASEPLVSADRVEIGVKEGSFKLEGNVRLRSDPFFLSADRMTLARDRYGVLVEGERASLAFCPCLGTPLRLRVKQAIIAPPGDLLLKHPVLELFGLPIAYVPLLWLRSRARVGVLPPEITYRASDGLRLGLGVHVPLFPLASVGSTIAERYGMDLRFAAYTRGGARTEFSFESPSTTASLAWDYLDSHGVEARVERTEGGLELSIDALRGARAVLATSDLSRAALPTDRAHLAVASVRPNGFYALGGDAFARRGSTGASDRMMLAEVLGPRVEVGGALFTSQPFSLEASFRSRALRDLEREVDVGFVEANALSRASFDVSAMRFVQRTSARAGYDNFNANAELRHDVRTSLMASVPLEATGTLQHRFEPAVGWAVVSASQTPYWSTLPGDLRRAVVGAIDSSLGKWGDRTGWDLTVRAGWDPWDRTTGLYAKSDVSIHALRIRNAVLVERGEALSTNEASLGTESGFSIGLDVASRAESWVWLRALSNQSNAWFSEAPISGRAGIFASVGPLRFEGRADVDLRAQHFLAGRSRIAFRDACRCFEFSIDAGVRRGREGVDVALRIDLSPR
ncbi:MAG: hypothetical protein KBF88_03040 [Polyangiaceae bacterium]|nr:hypothetical protein [Polyangiaceae bacterium]